MKILSFDVGIKNLAYCLIEFNNKDCKDHKILDWNIINCCNEVSTCCVCKKGRLCEKPAINYVMVGDKTLGFCKLVTCQKELNTTYSKSIIKKFKKENFSLETIGRILYSELEKLDIFLSADVIIIENQPVLKNPTMKSVQMLIYSFFLYKKCCSNFKYEIKLFNAGKKLKVYQGPEIDSSHLKGKYNQRKYESIKCTEYFIKEYNENYDKFFTNSKKKDDLADSYMQGLTFYFK